jgi:hypothetical protein
LRIATPFHETIASSEDVSKQINDLRSWYRICAFTSQIYSEIQTGAFWSRFEKPFKSEGDCEMKLLKFGRFFLGGLLLLTLLSLGACQSTSDQQSDATPPEQSMKSTPQEGGEGAAQPSGDNTPQQSEQGSAATSQPDSGNQ